MKCHYEVLGVQLNASGDEIKKAYKQKALKWHPDKNLDDLEKATEQFQLIQQAWEILSDPHTRAWYDNHREAILKGGFGEEYKDESIDLTPYFSTTCFKGYGDDEKGFYTIYRSVFEKLTAEDAEFDVEGDSDEEIPGFGDSQSSYMEVVHNFYAYWQSYTTKKSFSWLDPYDTRTVPNRRVLRLVERENKKVRDKAKKKRNEEVRKLVSFVRKRDKRVQAYAEKLAEQAKENMKKGEEKMRKELLKRQKQLKEYKECDWSKFSNVEAELKNIETHIAQEFGEAVSSEEDITDENAVGDNILYCVACTKVFKTQKSFTNHEKSKKHKTNVLVMKESIIEDDKEFNSSAEDSDKDASSEERVPLAVGPQMDDAIYVPPPVNEDSNDCTTSEDELFSDDSEEEGVQLKKQKKKRQKKNIKNLLTKSTSEEELNEDEFLSKKQLKKKQRKKLLLNQISDPNKKPDNNIEETEKQVIVESQNDKKQNKQAKKKSKANNKESAQKTNTLCCITCKSQFPNRNKLFDHLHKSKHMAPKCN